MSGIENDTPLVNEEEEKCCCCEDCCPPPPNWLLWLLIIWLGLNIFTTLTYLWNSI